jgi:hypothetical protein
MSRVCYFIVSNAADEVEEGETIHLHVVLPRFKNGWSYTSTPTYTFMVKLKVQVVPVHAMKLM